MLRNAVSIPLEQFYPFGNGISLRVPSGDDNTSPLISLENEFHFFNQSHTTLHVCLIITVYSQVMCIPDITCLLLGQYQWCNKFSKCSITVYPRSISIGW